MTTTATAARETTGRKPRSADASNLLRDLVGSPLEARRGFWRGLGVRDVRAVLEASQRDMGTPFGLWQDDPLGFVEDVLQERTWSIPERILNAIPHHDRIAIPSAFSTGKCVWEHETMLLSTGEVCTAGDLVGTEFTVLGWDERTATTRPRTARAEWNAVEPVFRVTTESGRQVVRNAAHPLWSGALRRQQQWRLASGRRTTGTLVSEPGWKPAADLTPGADVVLVPTRVDTAATDRIGHDRAALLGYLLGDGHTGKEVRFSHLPGETLDEFGAVIDRLGGRIAQYPSKGAHHEIVVRGTGERRGQWLVNPVVDLVRSWGLMGTKAINKTWPPLIWTLHPDDLAVVVGRLFACDGWATVRPATGQAQVAIGLSNESLIAGLHRLMLRLGVAGSVRRRKTTGSDSWEWSCSGEALLRFAEVVDVPGKREAVAAAAAAVQGRKEHRDWRTRCAPDGYRWEHVKSVERLPGEHCTVAVEVDDDHTWVDLFVEHNTWSVSRAVLWHANVWPVGTGRVVTIASKFDQVRTIIWPEIRQAHKRAGLPGVCDVTQMKMPNRDGQDYVVAEGIGAAPHNETAVQGKHAPHLMLIVDEAGGIGMRVGRNLRALLTAEGTSMVAIGNPPSDNEGSWFETLCAEEDVLVIPISAMDTPNLTGEQTDRCRSCPPEVPPHRLAVHLASISAVRETIELHGADSSYVQAKVLARFPKGGPDRALPSSWLENAAEALTDDEPADEAEVRLSDLGVDGVEQDFYVPLGAWVRLGVDVAADGGDELAISRIIGDLATIVHTSSGATNTNVTDVAGKVLAEIRRAEKIAVALGTNLETHPLRVKIDAIGIGWGVAGVLEAWGVEGMHHSVIVRVVVSEGTYRDDEDATFRPANKRAEMWLALRTLIQPRKDSKPIRLRVDRKTLAQLSAPSTGTNAHGRTTIETKASLKRKGLPSPDRAEAILLGFYEPMLEPPKRRARLLI